MNFSAPTLRNMENILMHGPAFDGSGRTVEREVPLADVKAYKAAGYAEGPDPAPAPKAEPKPEPKAPEEPKAELRKGKKK